MTLEQVANPCCTAERGERSGSAEGVSKDSARPAKTRGESPAETSTGELSFESAAGHRSKEVSSCSPSTFEKLRATEPHSKASVNSEIVAPGRTGAFAIGSSERPGQRIREGVERYDGWRPAFS